MPQGIWTVIKIQLRALPETEKMQVAAPCCGLLLSADTKICALLTLWLTAAGLLIARCSADAYCSWPSDYPLLGCCLLRPLCRLIADWRILASSWQAAAATNDSRVMSINTRTHTLSPPSPTPSHTYPHTRPAHPSTRPSPAPPLRPSPSHGPRPARWDGSTWAAGAGICAVITRTVATETLRSRPGEGDQ